MFIMRTQNSFISYTQRISGVGKRVGGFSSKLCCQTSVLKLSKKLSAKNGTYHGFACRQIIAINDSSQFVTRSVQTQIAVSLKTQFFWHKKSTGKQLMLFRQGFLPPSSDQSMILACRLSEIAGTPTSRSCNTDSQVMLTLAFQGLRHHADVRVCPFQQATVPSATFSINQASQP